MDRRQSARGRNIRRGTYAAWGIAYLVLCGSVVFAGAMLSIGGFVPPPRPQKSEIPVARIQFVPGSDDLCRVLLFHNDSGRTQDGGTEQCSNQISSDLLVWTTRRRTEAFAQAFRLR